MPGRSSTRELSMIEPKSEKGALSSIAETPRKLGLPFDSSNRGQLNADPDWSELARKSEEFVPRAAVVGTDEGGRWKRRQSIARGADIFGVSRIQFDSPLNYEASQSVWGNPAVSRGAAISPPSSSPASLMLISNARQEWVRNTASPRQMPL